MLLLFEVRAQKVASYFSACNSRGGETMASNLNDDAVTKINFILFEHHYYRGNPSNKNGSRPIITKIIVTPFLARMIIQKIGGQTILIYPSFLTPRKIPEKFHRV
jgi:hypothetical protein